ncbi:AraC-type DNA-binding protein [Flavobacterium segetis]|uniref:AraC-type DNA-binding protein n=1 Tax=Flavobacterium segetis TaxID=271157 RepID=A0A1M5IRR4_9FLAO|nr:helix-turn-helix transcriptional regulator [Flavobacterium segetis]SHG30689.1 AraC-type DNA-binding protein [Flavobacterium segetis]
MVHFNKIIDYNTFIGYKKPKKELIDVVRYDDCNDLRLSCSGLTSDFYMIAFKQNMSDLKWFGNTEYDSKSGFLYFIKPGQVHQWEVQEAWTGYHILISPLLLQEYNIDFSFLQYEINEALFLSKDEQLQIENLYMQLYDEYQKDTYELEILIAYCNLIFTHVVKFYKRQFYSREPLYNKIVVEFKKELNTYYVENENRLPTVHYFAEKLNLSTNYFGDLIKNHTGKTPSEIIQNKIITEAKQRLRSTEKTIAEIGYDLGFEYPTYFTRFFKKLTDYTPSEFKINKLR